jgi:hypothetical protein
MPQQSEMILKAEPSQTKAMQDQMCIPIENR